jgi:hypothetical protein
VALAQRHDPVQVLLLDRPDELFRVRVAVRRTGRCPDHATPATVSSCSIPVLHVGSRSQSTMRRSQRDVRGVRQLPHDLDHERLVRVRTSGAVDAEQLCGPERARLSEQLSVVRLEGDPAIARDPD